MVFTVLMVSGVKAANKEYKIGDTFSFRGHDYIVIEDSGVDKDCVVVLKTEPLTKKMVDDTNVSINSNISGSSSTANGEVAYYSNSSCGIVDGRVQASQDTCFNDYTNSYVKKVIDVWIKSFESSLVALTTSGTKARLLTVDDLIRIDNEYAKSEEKVTTDWLYNSNYTYWIDVGGQNKMANSYISKNGEIVSTSVYDTASIRPVLNFSKAAIAGESGTSGTSNGTNGMIMDDDSVTPAKTKNNKVSVSNTLARKSMITTIVGLALIGIGITTYEIILRKKRKHEKATKK